MNKGTSRQSSEAISWINPSPPWLWAMTMFGVRPGMTVTRQRTVLYVALYTGYLGTPTRALRNNINQKPSHRKMKAKKHNKKRNVLQRSFPTGADQNEEKVWAWTQTWMGNATRATGTRAPIRCAVAHRIGAGQP